MSLSSSVAVGPAEPAVVVRICNILGESVGPLTVTVESATHVPSSGVVVSKKPMTALAGDKSVAGHLTF